MFQKLALIGILLAITVGVRAGETTHQVDFNGLLPGTQTVQLPQYDGTFGTLTGLLLILEAHSRSGSITWENESYVVTKVDLGIGARVTATGPDLTSIMVIPLTLGSNSNVGLDDEPGAPDFAGLDSFTVFGTDTFDQKSVTPSDFTPYMGPGVFDVDIASQVAALHSARGGSGETQTNPGTVVGKVKVTYYFDAVPEPLSLGMLATGGVAVLIKRRNA
jgi:hypothetical protein